jgi:hypothetical protein
MAEWVIIDDHHAVNVAGVTEALFNVDLDGQWIARLWLATGEERTLRGDAVHRLRQLILEQPHVGADFGELSKFSLPVSSRMGE